MAQSERILYCRCAYARVIPTEVKDAVLQELIKSGVEFDAVPDLCEMSARCDPALKQLAAGGKIKIAACYPRAVNWLFSAAQAPIRQEDVVILNMRIDSAKKIVDRLIEQGPKQEQSS